MRLPAPAAPNNYNDPDPEYGYSYNGLFKLDYTINQRNSLSFHWFSGEGSQAAPVGSNLLWYYQVAPTHVQNYALVLNTQFSPTITNQVLLGTNYFEQNYFDVKSDFDPISLGFNTGAPVLGAPNIKLGQSSQLSQVGLTAPQARNDTTAHITDALTWIKGAHQFRLGGEFRHVYLNLAYFTGERGTFTFSGTQGPWSTNPTESDQAADPQRTHPCRFSWRLPVSGLDHAWQSAARCLREHVFGICSGCVAGQPESHCELRYPL